MSRIGKIPIAVPKGVDVKINGKNVQVSGPKGKVALNVNPRIDIEVADGKIIVKRKTDDAYDKALHGLSRSLINNMVTGVVDGFKKSLEIVGVGFKSKVEGKTLELSLGFTNAVKFPIPEGITISVEKNVFVHITGADKQAVGEIASRIRKCLPPEPYKGKGIRYVGEHVRRKAGKSVA